MQLPKNTVPNEPNFLAPFFPGAGRTSADADALSTVGTAAGKGEFGELFADLTTGITPAPKTADSASDALLANADLVFCPVPFVPVNVVEQPVATTESDVEADSMISPEGNETAVECPASTPTGETKGSRSTQGGRETRLPARATKTPAVSVRSRDDIEAGQEGVAQVATPAPGAPEHDRSEQQPNEHASEVAFQRPRFTGLPAAALEHRNTTKLPPGLTRLMAAHAGVASSPSISTEAVPPTESSVDTTPLPENESFPQVESAFEGTSSVWTDANARTDANAFASVAPALAEDVQTDDHTDVPAELPQAGDFAQPQVPVAPEATLTQSLSVPLDRLLERDLAAGFSPNIHATARPLVPTHERAETSEDSEAQDENQDQNSNQALVAAGPLVRDSIKRDLPDGSKPAAKIAVTPNREENDADDCTDKSFLETGNKRVASSRKQVGTDVAKTEADMFTRYLPTPASHAASDHAASGVVGLDRAHEVSPNHDLVPVAPVSTAHQAVEVVLKTVEQASTHEQKSVNLRFAVGDVDLSVRVELHANQVHTTFRTDSPELRAALSREWEAMSNTNPGERTLKLVPAFVTSSEQSAMNSFAGDTSSRQRDSHAQREAEERSFRVTPRARGAVTVAPVASSNAGITGTAPLTSRRLHTVA